MNFNEEDKRKSGTKKLFEGVMKCTIVHAAVYEPKQVNGKMQLAPQQLLGYEVADPDPYDENQVMQIGVQLSSKAGDPQSPINYVILFGGQPRSYNGKTPKHKWSLVYDAAMTDKTQPVNALIGKEVFALFYAVQAGDSHRTNIWGRFLEITGDPNDLEDWFQFAVANSPKLQGQLHPDSKYALIDGSKIQADSAKDMEVVKDLF